MVNLLNNKTIIMSVYLRQIPEFLKFQNSDKTIAIEVTTSEEEPLIYINDGNVTIKVSDIEFITNSLESIENIFKEIKNGNK